MSQSQSNHLTPGPWTWGAHGDGYHITGEIRGLWAKVATVHGMRPDNARLIAAAPDLLALAQQYASECSSCDGAGKVQMLSATGHPAGEVDCEDCADIRAVITKAEG